MKRSLTSVMIVVELDMTTRFVSLSPKKLGEIRGMAQTFVPELPENSDFPFEHPQKQVEFANTKARVSINCLRHPDLTQSESMATHGANMHAPCVGTK
ncbi:hypothetical protein ACSBR1_015561 [Camellia fascicularis]